MSDPHHGRRLNYSRLETDEEFKARITKARPSTTIHAAAGDDLDRVAWIDFGLQRRIVWQS